VPLGPLSRDLPSVYSLSEKSLSSSPPPSVPLGGFVVAPVVVEIPQVAMGV
jgi:hypothetical protein